MKCYECGGTYEQKSGFVKLNDKFVGEVSVSEIQYNKCNYCETMLFSPEALKKIEMTRNKILDDMIQKEPLNEFISPTGAAKILGISRQALHKHRRIRRGFIYQTTFRDKKVYLKQSVKLFKKTGDGRFCFVKPTPDPKYLLTNLTYSIHASDKFYNKETTVPEIMHLPIVPLTQTKGQEYVN